MKWKAKICGRDVTGINPDTYRFSVSFLFKTEIEGGNQI